MQGFKEVSGIEQTPGDEPCMMKFASDPFNGAQTKLIEVFAAKFENSGAKNNGGRGSALLNANQAKDHPKCPLKNSGGKSMKQMIGCDRDYLLNL